MTKNQMEHIAAFILSFSLIIFKSSAAHFDQCPVLRPVPLATGRIAGIWFEARRSENARPLAEHCSPVRFLLREDKRGLKINSTDFQNETWDQIETNGSSNEPNLQGYIKFILPNNPTPTVDHPNYKNVIYADRNFAILYLCQNFGSLFASQQIWVIARDPNPDPFQLKVITMKLASQGMDLKLLENDWKDCPSSVQQASNLMSKYPRKARKLQGWMRSFNDHRRRGFAMQRYTACLNAAIALIEIQNCRTMYEREIGAF